MVDRIRPLKLESVALGGSQDDFLPTAVNPAEDYAAVKGIALEDNDGTLIQRNADGNIEFVDVNGTNKLSALIGGGGGVTSVNGEVGAVVLDTDDIDEGTTNLYYIEARVSANTSVAANTAKVSADGSINTHSDVDITTTAPQSGESLIWGGTEFTPGPVLNETTHRPVDQLVHNIAETSYEEITRSGGNITDVIIWTSVAKTTKVRETNITRSGGSVSQTVEKQYNAAGTLVETLTSVISRTGGNIDNITNTLT
jgi:hypothetical protein